MCFFANSNSLLYFPVLYLVCVRHGNVTPPAPPLPFSTLVTILNYTDLPESSKHIIKLSVCKCRCQDYACLNIVADIIKTPHGTCFLCNKKVGKCAVKKVTVT